MKLNKDNCDVEAFSSPLNSLRKLTEAQNLPSLNNIKLE